MEIAQVVLDPYQTFQTLSVGKWIAILSAKKSLISSLFQWSYSTLSCGSGFLRHGVYDPLLHKLFVWQWRFLYFINNNTATLWFICTDNHISLCCQTTWSTSHPSQRFNVECQFVHLLRLVFLTATQLFTKVMVYILTLQLFVLKVKRNIITGFLRLDWV